MTPVGTPVTAGGRIHLLIKLIAFLAVAAGRLLCGLPAAQRPVVTRLVLTAHADRGTGHSRSCTARPPRFGVHSDRGLLEPIFLALELPWFLLAALRLTQGQRSRARGLINEYTHAA
jgi:hypothetical protein